MIGGESCKRMGGGRETILLGDEGQDRVLRRELYFAEPNSGRFTKRTVTGHVGGRSSARRTLPIVPLRSEPLPPPSQRLDKISHIRGEQWHASGGSSGELLDMNVLPTGGGGRGSNSGSRAHFQFAQGLRPATSCGGGGGHGANTVRVANRDEWRRVTGFPNPHAAAAAAPPSRRPAAAPLWDDSLQQRPRTAKPRVREYVFDSEEDRKRTGFVDKGLRRRPWPSNYYGAVGRPTTLGDRPRTTGPHGGGGGVGRGSGGTRGGGGGGAAIPPAGGPGGCKALVDWRDWKEDMRNSHHRNHQIELVSSPIVAPSARSTSRGGTTAAATTARTSRRGEESHRRRVGRRGQSSSTTTTTATATATATAQQQHSLPSQRAPATADPGTARTLRRTAAAMATPKETPTPTTTNRPGLESSRDGRLRMRRDAWKQRGSSHSRKGLGPT